MENETAVLGRAIIRGQRKRTSLRLGCLWWGWSYSGREIWVKGTSLDNDMELRNILVCLKTFKLAGVATGGGVRLERLEGAGPRKACVPG